MLYTSQECEFRPTREKEHDGHRIADGKPVDLNVAHPEVAVPTGGPGYVTRVPYHTVRKHHRRHLSWKDNNYVHVYQSL